MITQKTKAIIPVHYAGVPCNMEKINKIAKKYNLYVIEDAAQAVNSKYKGKYLGTLGDIGCYSFHKTKNFSMGEGGAILINNSKFISRAEIIREKGTNKNSFMRGETNKYTWVDIGSSYIPSNINSAYLFSQLEEIKNLQEKRNTLYRTYYSNLEYLARQGMIVLPAYQGNSHLFYIVLNTSKIRDTLLYFLHKNEIRATFHFLPLHKSSYYKKNFKHILLPVTEKLSGRILRLPLYYELKVSEINKICKLIGEFFEK